MSIYNFIFIYKKAIFCKGKPLYIENPLSLPLKKVSAKQTNEKQPSNPEDRLPCAKGAGIFRRKMTEGL
jgi:hypothetical protein